MKQTFLLPELASLFFMTLLLSLSSCKKDSNTNNADNPDPALSLDAVQSSAVAESQFEDVFNISMNVLTTDAGENIGLGTGANVIYRTDGTEPSDSRCYTVTVTPKILHEFPKTVTIDFGAGCVGKDGKTRSGKVVTIFSGPMLIPGSKASTTFINYSADSFKIEGTHTIENKSALNHLALQVKVIDGKISNTQSNKWIQWNSLRDYAQIKGNGSPFYSLDNVYQLTGNAEGSTSAGNSWTAEISQPVIKKFSCTWPVNGEIVFTRNSSAKATLGFGDGACDDKATVMINGKSYPITLH